MTRVMHVLLTGLLRPSIEYVMWFCTDIRKKLPGCKVHILYWETCEEDKKRLEEVFDSVYAVPEISDSILFRFIRARTLQQKQVGRSLERITPRIYKIFYGVRCIIDKLNIPDSETVMRIRTDNYIQKIEFPQPGPNQFLFCPKKSCGDSCDWFGVSTLETLKKLYYINDNMYNHCVKNAWNSENIIINNAKIHGVEMVSINSTTRLAIAREYPPLKLHYYD